MWNRMLNSRGLEAIDLTLISNCFSPEVVNNTLLYLWRAFLLMIERLRSSDMESKKLLHLHLSRVYSLNYWRYWMLLFGFGNLDIYWETLKTEGTKRFRFKMLLHVKNNCVTLHSYNLYWSWAALSFNVCQWVRHPWHLSRSPLCSIYKGINALYWPNNINYCLILTHTEYHQVPSIVVCKWPVI